MKTYPTLIYNFKKRMKDVNLDIHFWECCSWWIHKFITGPQGCHSYYVAALDVNDGLIELEELFVSLLTLFIIKVHVLLEWTLDCVHGTAGYSLPYPVLIIKTLKHVNPALISILL